VAHVMMPDVYWLWSRHDRWASYIGNPTAQVPASADPHRRNHSRRASAPMRTPSHPTGWSLLSLSGFYPFSSLMRLRRIFPGRLSPACQSQDGRCLSFSHSRNRRLYQRLSLVCPALPPSGLPTGSTADAALAALVCPEHQALARKRFRLMTVWHKH